jgi:hypothetical protein
MMHGNTFRRFTGRFQSGKPLIFASKSLNLFIPGKKRGVLRSGIWNASEAFIVNGIHSHPVVIGLGGFLPWGLSVYRDR